MGDVIRPSAPVDEIFKDARRALNNAIARGGKVQERATEGLGPVVAMVEAIEAELGVARELLAPLSAAASAENEHADAAINGIYDETWNDAGRLANDRYLALMYPGGPGYYTDGDTAGQPARLEMLAKLYDRKLHPGLTAAQSQGYALRVRDAAAALEDDVVAAATPAANATHLEQVRNALGRIAQSELATLKRTFKNDGMDEAAIHTIIPDHPLPAKAPKKPEAAAVAPPPAAAAPAPDPAKPAAPAPDPAKPAAPSAPPPEAAKPAAPSAPAPEAAKPAAPSAPAPEAAKPATPAPEPVKPAAPAPEPAKPAAPAPEAAAPAGTAPDAAKPAAEPTPPK